MQPFIGLDDLSDVLGEDVSGSDLAVIAIDASCQTVRDELGHDVNLIENDIRALDGNNRYRLLLPEPPVWEVSEVILDDETLETTDYAVDNGAQIRGMYLRRVGNATWLPVWTYGLANVQITYTHGWAVTEEDALTYDRVPSSIRRVALSLARRVYTNNGSSGASGATTSIKLGSASESYDVGTAVALSSSELLDSELATLQPYKVLGFA